MSRPLTADIAALVRPMPDDFTLALEDHGRYVRWESTLTVEGHGPVEVELGYSRAAGDRNEPIERAILRERAWQAMELARLGRTDLLDYCMVDRHKRARPISKVVSA